MSLKVGVGAIRIKERAMKHTLLTPITTLLFSLLVAVHAEEAITVQTQDNGAALVNPGMGWMAYFCSNVPTNYGSHLAPASI